MRIKRPCPRAGFLRRSALVVAASLAVPLPAASATEHPATAHPARADLRADVNRDGRVDVAGSTDEDGEDRWTRQRGAVYLPNLDDDSRRCPSDATPASMRCNDAADEVVNGPADARDLARLRTVPLRVPDTARGTLRVVGGGRALTRLFLRAPGGWTRVAPDTRLTADQLRAGVEVGMEARDVVRDSAVWNGEADVELAVDHGSGRVSADRVRVRVAPLLTHHHLQRAKELLIEENDASFVDGLEEEARRAGVATRRLAHGPFWTQDYVEPGYVSMAAPGGGLQAMRVLIRTVQEEGDPPGPRGAEQLYPLRGRDVAVLETPEDPASDWNLNSFGNLETIPPYTHRGRSFPAGRIIMGQRGTAANQRPARTVTTMLSAQGVQDPLMLDTSWLGVGHVDEFVQFLPASTPRGWRIGVADPLAGLELLGEAWRGGHGGTRMFSWPGNGETPPLRETVADAWLSAEVHEDNRNAARAIEANLDVLKAETGVTDAEIVRVPALFTRGTECLDDSGGSFHVPTLFCPFPSGSDLPDSVDEYGQDAQAPDGPPQASGQPPRVSAFVPGAVNGVLLSRDRYAAPTSWGPVIDGRDIFADAVTAAYRAAGIQVSYIDTDEFFLVHLGEGELHCASNTLRDTSRPWWGTPARAPGQSGGQRPERGAGQRPR